MTPASTQDLRTPDGPVAVPAVGLGTYELTGDALAPVVRAALGAGYRAFDTASFYGNEVELGAALLDSGLPRDEYLVTTKVWKDAHGTGPATASVRDSLERLGGARLGWVDIALIHWPCPELDLYVETWRALQALRDEGLVRVIGVSNFLPEHLQRLFDETGEWPALNQVELHPAFQQRALTDFHAEHGIVTQAWRPLGNGSVLKDPTVVATADRLGCTPAQLVLSWSVQRGNLVLPRTSNPGRVAENLVVDVALDDQAREALDALDSAQGRLGPDPATGP